MARKKKLKPQKKTQRASSRRSDDSAPRQQPNEPASAPSSVRETRFKWILAGLLVLVFCWSYWPTLLELAAAWDRIPDYSHGYLVIPLALLFLWLRRESRPQIDSGIAWAGLLLIVVAGLLRWISAYYYLNAFDGWSIPLWLGGFTLLFCGWRVFFWALPATAFLVFMVPIPYTFENLLAQPLQAVSTAVSCFILQCLQVPAFAEGNVIMIPETLSTEEAVATPELYTLEVARACSGLRIFFGIAALAYACLILFPRPFWTKILIGLGVLPISILANSVRIVVTGFLYQVGWGEAANKFGHDAAGWFMIPLAAALFGLFLVYLDRLFPTIETVGTETLVRSQTRRKAATT